MTEILVQPKTGPKTRREILLDAAALIEEHGWGFGPAAMPRHEDHDGRLCILGGIAKAMGSPDCGYLDASLVVHRGGSYDPCQVFLWNDNLGYEVPLDVAQKRVTTALRKLADGATWAEASA